MKNNHIHLIAFYSMKPRDPKKTHIKGYMKDPENVIYDERVEFTHGLSNKDRQYANVILDLNTLEVVTNKFNDERDFDKLFEYFHENYSKYLDEIMSTLHEEYKNGLQQNVQAEEETSGGSECPAETDTAGT